MPFLLMSGTPSKASSSPLETVLVEVGWELSCDNRRLEWVLGPHFRVIGQPYLFKVINTLPVSCCFNGIGQSFFVVVVVLIYIWPRRSEKKELFNFLKKLLSFNVQTNN